MKTKENAANWQCDDEGWMKYTRWNTRNYR